MYLSGFIISMDGYIRTVISRNKGCEGSGSGSGGPS